MDKPVVAPIPDVNKKEHKKSNTQTKATIKKAITSESLFFVAGAVIIFGVIGSRMGGVNMVNTMIATAYDLLFNTAFFIMAVAVLAGAVSELLIEFGIIAVANKLLSPIVKPIFGLPGASMIGIFTTYLSDNPAILPFANNKTIKKYFKRYQLPALTNIGTAFGMGLIVTTVLAALKSPTGENFLPAVLIGNIGAVIGAIVSTRLMLVFTAKKYGKEAECSIDGDDDDFDIMNYRVVREGGVGSRLMTAALDGGKSGVDLGISIIPGILIITTLIILLTNTGKGIDGAYLGVAGEGIGLLPFLGSKIEFILKPLFGFANPESVVVPITALGAAGAAIGIVPDLVSRGIADAHDVAVFTAMCMCFSGYLCTHVVMMESLGEGKLTSKAILSHTIGGICAGVAANIIYRLVIG